MKPNQLNDPHFKVITVETTPNPQRIIYTALHQDYSDHMVMERPEDIPDEKTAGELAIKYLLKGGRGHYGPFEHPQMVLNFGYFPHSTMQQVRTHRNVSFDVQCLVGNTKIKKSDGQSITIKELFELPKDEWPLLRSYCEKTKKFTGNKIADVFEGGVKSVYKMTLKNGNQITASKLHRFLTKEGWRRLEDIRIGDTILCNGIQGTAAQFYTDKTWLENKLSVHDPIEIAEELNVSYEVIKKYAYQYGLTWKKRKTGVPLGYRFNKWSKHANKPFTKGHVRWWMKNNSTKIRGGRSCFACGQTESIVLHHIVPVDEDIQQAYNFRNLLPLCRPCHAQVHCNKLTANESQVLSIEYMGEEPTYDISMDSSIHNFVAEGIITHNSFRYTSDFILRIARFILDVEAQTALHWWDTPNAEDIKGLIEKAFYWRPVGSYTDRSGITYDVTEPQIQEDIVFISQAIKQYFGRISSRGYSEEHARGIIPFDVRQHWVMSGNSRAIMHLLDIRGKFDVQLETRIMCEMMFREFKGWMPEIAAWYEETRWRKGVLSP